ncbi:hypothetical protein [Heyndrickxia coagulans]|uniref:hypothetical protein n=1 Tax=Heyndrickxia coagulans TaxID=1398 RepID=UPI0012D88CED|nr:hypothetical protein [Heyndrickxia coagulans]
MRKSKVSILKDLSENIKVRKTTGYFSDPDITVFQKWQNLSGGLIKKVALAPERKGVEEFVVRKVTEQGTVAALGPG